MKEILGYEIQRRKKYLLKSTVIVVFYSKKLIGRAIEHQSYSKNCQCESLKTAILPCSHINCEACVSK